MMADEEGELSLKMWQHVTVFCKGRGFLVNVTSYSLKSHNDDDDNNNNNNNIIIISFL